MQEARVETGQVCAVVQARGVHGIGRAVAGKMKTFLIFGKQKL